MTLQELEQIKHRILAERAMAQNSKSPRITVGMGTCGRKAGAGAVITELENILAQNNDVVLTEVGCIGLCSYEPVVEIAIAGRPVVTYGHMTPDKVRKVIEEHIGKGIPVQKWVIATREQ